MPKPIEEVDSFLAGRGRLAPGFDLGTTCPHPWRIGFVGCSRRRFLKAAAHAAAGATFASCAAPFPTERSSAVSTVIDTHTHFYDPTRPQGVPWPSREDTLLYRRVLPEDYQRLPTPRSVTGTVVVEASSWLEDNQWVLDLAALDPFIVGFVGNLPLGTDEFAGHLKRFAANKKFRGIRVGARKIEVMRKDTPFLRDLRLLSEHGLSLDLLGGKEILPFAAELAQEVPQLRIIIDHLAGLIVDGKAPPAEWQKQMSSLAQKPGIYYKLSGLVEGTGRTDGAAPRDVEFYTPVLNVMSEMFGPERLIYASNWPVSERFAPLATVQGIVEDYFTAKGREAQEQVFSRSGKAAYRWIPR